VKKLEGENGTNQRERRGSGRKGEILVSKPLRQRQRTDETKRKESSPRGGFGCERTRKLPKTATRKVAGRCKIGGHNGLIPGGGSNLSGWTKGEPASETEEKKCHRDTYFESKPWWGGKRWGFSLLKGVVGVCTFAGTGAEHREKKKKKSGRRKRWKNGGILPGTIKGRFEKKGQSGKNGLLECERHEKGWACITNIGVNRAHFRHQIIGGFWVEIIRKGRGVTPVSSPRKAGKGDLRHEISFKKGGFLRCGGKVC